MKTIMQLRIITLSLLVVTPIAHAQNYTFQDLGEFIGGQTGLNNPYYSYFDHKTENSSGQKIETKYSHTFGDGSYFSEYRVDGQAFVTNEGVKNKLGVLHIAHTIIDPWNGYTDTHDDVLFATFANSINKAGLIVGEGRTTHWNQMNEDGDSSKKSSMGMWNNDGYYIQHATLWNAHDFKALDLNTFLDAATVNAGWVLESGHEITDAGAVKGIAYNQITGKVHTFQLAPVAPVPEPETNALMGMGLVGLIAACRRKIKAA